MSGHFQFRQRAILQVERKPSGHKPRKAYFSQKIALFLSLIGKNFWQLLYSEQNVVAGFSLRFGHGKPCLQYNYLSDGENSIRRKVWTR